MGPTARDAAYIKELLKEQSGRCALSGLPIVAEEKTGTASLDRKDSSKGYVPGNVQWLQ